MASLPLTKINQLVKAEGFLQVHYLKGYKYIDKAGELINFFHTEDNRAPLFSMSVDGLVIKEPLGKAEELKISSTDFWTHFVGPESLELMEDFFQPNADAITNILEVAEIKRVGWRIYFVQEFNSESERDAALKKFVPIDELSFGEVYFTSKIQDVSLNVRLRNVVKNEGEENSVPGILIDVDFYKNSEEGISSATLLSELENFKAVIRSDEFLEFVNKILE